MTSCNPTDHGTVGSGRFTYEPVPQWEKLPEGMDFVEAVGAATDSKDRVYVFNRGEYPIVVLDRDGNFLNAWGQGQFVSAHGITVGPDDMLYLSDHEGHAVRKFTPEGELVLTIGPSGQASDSGIQGINPHTITRGAPPFNLPTNLILDPDGNMYITDGYGNARVHKFSADGTLLHSWGEPGDGPGQFMVPHGIGMDSDRRLYVADRENSRIQIFDVDGQFLEQWTDVVRPCEVFVDAGDHVFVAELGGLVGMYVGWLKPRPPGGRVSIFDRQGNLLAQWGGGERPGTPGDFLALHDIWMDSQGSIYTSEVIESATKNQAPPGCPSLQKFVRKT